MFWYEQCVLLPIILPVITVFTGAIESTYTCSPKKKPEYILEIISDDDETPPPRPIKKFKLFEPVSPVKDQFPSDLEITTSIETTRENRLDIDDLEMNISAVRICRKTKTKGDVTPKRFKLI